MDLKGRLDRVSRRLRRAQAAPEGPLVLVQLVGAPAEAGPPRPALGGGAHLALAVGEADVPPGLVLLVRDGLPEGPIAQENWPAISQRIAAQLDVEGRPVLVLT